MERRLAAILAADVVGYSRLMGQDEAGTLARLEGLKAEILDPLIAQHRGRVVKLMGDGFLVEFASVVDVLTCALDWQGAVEARAGLVPEDRALRFRIGVNLGDVMVKGDDIYGDGVNVAARLEGLAEPGSILVSRTVFTHVKGKVAATFEDLGEQELKNIAEPVRVFRASMAPNATGAPAAAKAAPKSRRLPVIAVILVLLVVVAGAAFWQRPWEPREEPASVEAMAFPLSRHAPVAKAIDYMLKRWPGFTRFLDDGRVCLTNNAAERALRGIALGRKSWLFAGSDRGGDRAAFMYTLIVTAKMNDVDPQAWLADVLARIAEHPFQRLDELLPWNWKKTQAVETLAA